MFGLGKDKGAVEPGAADLSRDVEALERRVRKIENERTSQSLEWLEYVTKLERLVRRLTRAGGANQGPAPFEGDGRDTPSTPLAPPRGLKGARLRIWMRDHSGPREIAQPGAPVEHENGTEA